MLEYTENLNMVEYKNLQKWLEDFINKYKNDIYEDEMMLVNTTDLKSKITIVIDCNNIIRLYLYINNKCIHNIHFKENKIAEMDKRFLELLSKLKNSTKQMFLNE